MKLKISLLVALATQALSMEQEDILDSSLLHAQLRPTIQTLNVEDLNLTTRYQRFFKLDKTQKTPIIEQLIAQAKEIYQTRQLYMIDQKEFLEELQKKANGAENTNLQNLHPWFSEMSTGDITRILSKNIKTYAQTIASFGVILDYLENKDNTIDSIFVNIMRIRLSTLQLRDQRKTDGIHLPSTTPESLLTLGDYDKFVAWEAITNFRIYDEILFALFPHISQSTFREANEITIETTAIQQDLALMQFLDGQLNVSFDPDTSTNMRDLPGTIKKIFISQTCTYQQIVIPTIPVKYNQLYTKLLNCLPKEKEDISSSFLPEYLKKFEEDRKKRQKKEKPKRAKKRKAKTVKTPSTVPAAQSLTTAEKGSDITKPSLNKAKTNAIPKAKIDKPIGGWSAKDKERSAQSEVKMQSLFLEKSSKTKNRQTQFHPESPITLSTGQHRTLQEILSLDTPMYTMTFERVRDLLEGIGIRVERNGGSHAHIYTPGHNMKILVDTHYGWTDAYGPGTMRNLRELMQNLGLDNNDFIKIKQD